MLTSYSVSFIKYYIGSAQAKGIFRLYLYLGIVEELAAGGHGDILGDILGVPPAEIQDDNAGIST